MGRWEWEWTLTEVAWLYDFFHTFYLELAREISRVKTNLEQISKILLLDRNADISSASVCLDVSLKKENLIKLSFCLRHGHLPVASGLRFKALSVSNDQTINELSSVSWVLVSGNSSEVTVCVICAGVCEYKNNGVCVCVVASVGYQIGAFRPTFQSHIWWRLGLIEWLLHRNTHCVVSDTLIITHTHTQTNAHVFF